ncbi:S8 family serine peptidase [Limibacterium fermenti]|uniref:S8 family serine peptidase n=1 Tax=Limibacterium fermenti TaxID=3229863 RepID=UPI003A6B5DF7
MRFLFTTISIVFLSIVCAVGQQIPLQYKFRVYLSDKGSGDYSAADPDAFLSRKAIERKKRQGVAIDSTDFPISADYFIQMSHAGGKVVSFSKWFRTMVVEVPDSARIESIAALPFIDSVKYVWRGRARHQESRYRPRLEKTDCPPVTADHSYFGLTDAQFGVHNARKLLLGGFQGKGLQVGVIDAGFTNYDVIPYFAETRLAGFADFVPTGCLFSANDHGTKVLSTMAVLEPRRMVGASPEASFWLLRSEDVTGEYPVEEDYWLRAAEYADSVGVDVINTSLGYNDFDDESLNYTHADLTGDRSLMSLAADKAYDKGMLVIVSAGNEGNKPWRKITAPGDARKVITVGAVGTDSLIASFSSRGPSANGRVKPDLVSIGKATVTVGYNGRIGTTNGTSLSSPFLAGLMTSLWSVNPFLHRDTLVDIVKRSANRYSAPDTIYGYGIPDFGKAMVEVLQTLRPYSRKVEEGGWNIRPDFSGKSYTITLRNPEYSFDAYAVKVLDEAGNVLADVAFEKEDTVRIPLSKEVRKTNRSLFFTVSDPFSQQTYRIAL